MVRMRTLFFKSRFFFLSVAATLLFLTVACGKQSVAEPWDPAMGVGYDPVAAYDANDVERSGGAMQVLQGGNGE